MRQSQFGFTLVELSMVLLIVAVLLSGMMKAQAMIENAQIRSDIKKLAEFKVLTLLYKDKTRQLPGEDDSHPGRFKTVLSTEIAPTEGYFYDIYHANLSKSISPAPSIGSAFKATWGGSSGDNYGLIAGVNQLCITQIDVDLAEAVEAQLDEGSQNSGDVEYTLNGSQLCMKID
ncbi:MAG: prepilin-type N-terminal cleavage/methylation domain-containing protein [Pseudomonadota bacterium]|nr:prepilin-type N-terminal cleavage/methylation domain-containing protein [Pseudomonadota bacterium]